MDVGKQMDNSKQLSRTENAEVLSSSEERKNPWFTVEHSEGSAIVAPSIWT